MTVMETIEPFQPPKRTMGTKKALPHCWTGSGQTWPLRPCCFISDSAFTGIRKGIFSLKMYFNKKPSGEIGQTTPFQPS
jgi:hypothetical protein